MDIGKEKGQYKNYLKHQAQQNRGQKNGYWLHYPKYIYQHQNILLDLMRVCHYMLSQKNIHQADILYLPHDKYKKKI